jgi:hypothetical protein
MQEKTMNSLADAAEAAWLIAWVRIRARLQARRNDAKQERLQPLVLDLNAPIRKRLLHS